MSACHALPGLSEKFNPCTPRDEHLPAIDIALISQASAQPLHRLVRVNGRHPLVSGRRRELTNDQFRRDGGLLKARSSMAVRCDLQNWMTSAVGRCSSS